MSFKGNSSYLYGEDRISGWGWRYFFTFYNEIGPRGCGPLIEVTIFVVIFVLSVVTNVTIAAAILRYKEMRTVTNCFLLNLTIADLVFASSIPALIHARLSTEWKLSNLICKLLPYSQFVCGFVLLWTLTWISMDRYRCIVVPPFRSQLTPVRAAGLAILTWIVALVIFLPVVLWFREQTAQNFCICTLVFPRNDIVNLSLLFTVVMLVVSCVTPLSLFVYYYQRIFQKLKSSRERWSSKKSGNAEKSPNLFSEQEELRLNRHLKVIRILLLNVLAVLIMWLPITVAMFLIYLDGSRSNDDTQFFLRSHHFIWALQIALVNTIVNPLLYGVLSENFRKCFSRMWFLSKRKKALIKGVYNQGFETSNRAPSFIKQHYHFTSTATFVIET